LGARNSTPTGPVLWRRKPRWTQISGSAQFDITCDSINHLAFGAGLHVYAGINLARLEMNAIFSSLAKMVRRIHIEHEERIVNNVLHGFAKLSVSVERY
jgi:cytochrome P450